MRLQQTDLFGPALPEGLHYSPDFLDAGEENSLVAALGNEPFRPFRFQGWEGHRLTTSYGWHYDFDRGRVAPASPFPPWLAPFRARAEAVAGVAPGTLVQALLIHYPAGAGIGWHRDRPQFEEVLGISLGAPATLRLRRRTGDRRFERASLPLPPRSLYLLRDEARHDWEHSIAPIDAPRWSITFRALSALGLRQTQNDPGESLHPGRPD